MNSRFHHRGITRLAAEQLLVSNGSGEGSFLVRDSETTQGAYTLCILTDENMMKQFRILPDNTNQLFIQAQVGVNERRFPNLNALVEHYISRGEHNGLQCALKSPVAEEGSSDDDEDDLDADDIRPALIASSVTSPQPAVTAPATQGTLGVTEYFKKRFQTLDLSLFDGEFVEKVRDYSESGVTSDCKQIVGISGSKAPKLDILLNDSFQNVVKAVEVFALKLDTIRELFAPLQTAKISEQTATISQKEHLNESLAATSDRVRSMKTSILNLHSKANSQFSKLNEGNDVAPPRPKPREDRPIPPRHFKVKQLKQTWCTTAMILTVDVQQGKLLVAKESSANDKFTDVLTHDKVTKVVKNTKNNRVLNVHVSGTKRDSYEFESTLYRESFCQLVQQMKLQHSCVQQLESISLFIGTWNLGDSGMPSGVELIKWLTCQGTGRSRDKELRHTMFDMYVFGFQESNMKEDKLVKKLQEIFSSLGLEREMYLVASKMLWSIGIMVFIKPEYKDKIYYLETASEATGIANALGNKGGVAVSLSINGTSLCFVNAHLAARQDAARNERRNQNFRDIVKGMRHLGSKKLNGVVDLTNKFHHIFFFGDLNYRIDDNNTKEVLELIEKEEFPQILANDQLYNSKSEGKAFVDFREAEITFPPTYRIKKGTVDEYVVEKIKKTGIRYNTPSWCDRVLWRSYPELQIYNSSYGSIKELTNSDHKPVFSSFHIGISPDAFTVPDCNETSCEKSSTTIVFEEVNAQVQMNSSELLTLEIHSPILEKFQTSKKNKYFSGDQGCCPMWRKADLPTLEPLIGDVGYLEEHHLILVVKSEDNMESHGEAVISLKNKCSRALSRFSCNLTHQGEKTGTISGSLYLQGASNKSASRRNDEYVFIGLDVDVYGHVESTPAPHAAVTESPVYSDVNDTVRPVITDTDDWQASAAGASLYYEELPGPNNKPLSATVPKPSALHPQPPPPAQHSKSTGGKQKPSQAYENIDEIASLSSVSHGKQPKGGRDTGRSYMNVTPTSTTVKPAKPASSAPPVLQPRQKQTQLPPPPAAAAATGKQRPGTAGVPVATRLDKEEKDEVYDVLERPASVQQWLSALNLAQYSAIFLNNGWDQVQFLNSMTRQDLYDLNITDETHQMCIMQNIKALKCAVSTQLQHASTT